MPSSPGNLDNSERYLARRRDTLPHQQRIPASRSRPFRELQPAPTPRVNALDVPLAAAAAAL